MPDANALFRAISRDDYVPAPSLRERCWTRPIDGDEVARDRRHDRHRARVRRVWRGRAAVMEEPFTVVRSAASTGAGCRALDDAFEAEIAARLPRCPIHLLAGAARRRRGAAGAGRLGRSTSAVHERPAAGRPVAMSLMRRGDRRAARGVERTLAATRPAAAALAAAVRARGCDVVVLVARGTSDHAAIYARYLLEARCGLIASLAAPSLYTAYRAPVDLSRALVIGVSQSGETPEISSSLAYAKERGALTAGAHQRRRLRARADGRPRAGDGRRRGAVGRGDEDVHRAAGGGRRAGRGARRDRPGAARRACRPRSRRRSAAARRRRRRRRRSGHGPGRGLRGARLRVHRRAGGGAEAQGDDRACGRRGSRAPTCATARRRRPRVCRRWCSTPAGRSAPTSTRWRPSCQARGGRVISFGPGREVPAPVLSEELAPFTLVVGAQLLAERVSILRGRDPDRPPGLTKVTRTH